MINVTSRKRNEAMKLRLQTRLDKVRSLIAEREERLFTGLRHEEKMLMGQIQLLSEFDIATGNPLVEQAAIDSETPLLAPLATGGGGHE